MQCNVGEILQQCPSKLKPICGVDSTPISRDKEFFELCMQKLMRRVIEQSDQELAKKVIQIASSPMATASTTAPLIWGSWYGQCPRNQSFEGAQKAFGVASYHFENLQCC